MITHAQLQLLHEDFDQVVQSCGRRLDILEGSKVTVTGACGFLGSYIIDFLSYLNESYLVHACSIFAVDNLLVSNSERLSHLQQRHAITLELSDVCEVGLPTSDFILNAASVASPILYKKYPLETAKVNALGILNILEQAYDARCIVHFSSSEVYGMTDDAHLPTREEYHGDVSCNGPRSCYDESKRFSETICAIFYGKFDRPVRVIRPFNVYGPGMNLDDGRIMPNLLRCVVRGEPFEIFGPGTATRTYTYASDFLTQLMLVLTDGKNGETYNLGNDREEMSVKGLTILAQNIWDRKPEVRHIDPGVELVDATTRRLPHLGEIKALGYVPKIDLPAGMERTRRFYG